MAIDDRIEKIRDITNEEVNGLLGGLMQASGIFSPILAAIVTVKDVLDSKERQSRIWSAIRALCDELESLRAQFSPDLQSTLNAPWFRRAVQVLLEEASRAEDQRRAITLAVATAHGCCPSGENQHRREDLASYIHDLARLGKDDVQMLKLLRDTHSGAIETTPNMHDPNYFTERFENFRRQAAIEAIHPDDCIALGARLSGFGLAYEVQRNPGRQAPGEHCFRPTRRGVYLLSLLEASEAHWTQIEGADVQPPPEE